MPDQIPNQNSNPTAPSDSQSKSNSPATSNHQPGKRVLIVGGGFAGINAAKSLSEDESLEITILDRHNYHLFQPLLYQVAMAGLSPGEIAMPIRTILANRKNVRVLMAEAQSVDLKSRKVKTDYGDVEYDYLILACGAQHSYFGHEEWEPNAPGLKTLEQATEVRRRILMALEMAERETNPDRVRELLTFVIVGGGPTGVELAGALGEITRHTLSKDFRQIDPTRTRIIMIEAGPRILPSFDNELSKKAARDLEELGVTIWTNSRVTSIDADGVTLGQEKVRSATVLWAAGVKPAAINATLGVPLDRAGRVMVGPDLSIPDYPEVFVVGDQASFTEKGKPLPGLAPVAMQQGYTAADNILADQKRKMRKKFTYWDKGQMATIGRGKAVAQTGNLKMSGVVAWLAWLLVHIYYLVGFKNRLIVLIQWFWAYATYKRGAQLIVNKEWRSFMTPGEAAGQSGGGVESKPVNASQGASSSSSASGFSSRPISYQPSIQNVPPPAH